MTAERINPFAEHDNLPRFETKPKVAKSSIAKEQVDRIAADNDFPSRQARPTSVAAQPAQPAKRKPYRHRTGRNQQINIKTTSTVIERLYQLADARQVPLGELLEQALDALDEQRHA